MDVEAIDDMLWCVCVCVSVCRGRTRFIKDQMLLDAMQLPLTTKVDEKLGPPGGKTTMTRDKAQKR